MPVFEYVAKEQTGKTITGTLEYSEKVLLIDTLRKRGLVIISITELKKKGGNLFSKKIKLDDIVLFSRQLATLIDSGISLVQCIDILYEQLDKPNFKRIVGDIRDQIEVGSSFSDALSRHKDVFSPLYINMVKAGESSGSLDEILDRLSFYLEKTSSLQRKVKTSLIYPAIVISVAVLITLFMLLKVIPTFKGIFDLLGGELPMPTRVLIGISDFLRHSFIYLSFIFVGIVIGLRRFIKTDTGRSFCDRLSLKLPILGQLFNKVAVAKFSRTLATLIKSGVPILVSLEIVGKTSGNTVIEKAVDTVRVSIKEGESIANPIAKSKVFPPLVVKMIGVGEQSGQLEKMLGKIADFYEDQVDTAVSGLSSIIEPLIIVFLGVMIGGIVVAMFLPIFKMTELIAR